MKVYTGIGSRETPDEILGIMRSLAHELAAGALGADQVNRVSERES